MTAPTEEEIRAAIAREWAKVHSGSGFSIEVDFEDGIGGCDRLLDGLYNVEDFRESELQRFDDLLFTAVDPIRDRARREINEALVAAALAFAAEHPDAPRAAVPPSLRLIPRGKSVDV